MTPPNEDDGYEQASSSLAGEYDESETLEHGDGPVTGDQSLPSGTEESVERVAAGLQGQNAEIYGEVLDAAAEVAVDLYEAHEGAVDPDMIRDEVSRVVGDANAAIGRMQDDRDAYQRAANEVTEALYAMTQASGAVADDLSEINQAVDYIQQQVVSSPNTTFNGGDNSDTVEEIQNFAREIVGEDEFSTTGLLEGTAESTTRATNTSNRTSERTRTSGTTGNQGTTPTQRTSRTTTDSQEFGQSNQESRGRDNRSVDVDHADEVNVENADEVNVSDDSDGFLSRTYDRLSFWN